MARGLYSRLEEALLEKTPDSKCAVVNQLAIDWNAGELVSDDEAKILPLDDPGRPERPRLVDPRILQRRSTATGQGRIYLLHAIAHIEFCAINIALDAVYRFRSMPAQYVGDWLGVAVDEAKHFSLLEDCLRARGSCYGEFEAHGGLWDMVCKTRHDVLHRMALVPRVMEARGLDVTPGMIKRFRQVDDHQAADILEIIYEEEIGHVAVGSFWFESLCRQRGLEPDSTFVKLINDYFENGLRGPFNRSARLKAGFSETELGALEKPG